MMEGMGVRKVLKGGESVGRSKSQMAEARGGASVILAFAIAV